MKFFRFKFCCCTLITIIAITSCNAIRQSSFSKNNLIKRTFYFHYFNPQLKLYIRFFGGHDPINPPLLNYNRHTPKKIKSFLNKELKQKNNYKILFYSYSPGKAFGFYYVGFLHKHSLIEVSYKKSKSISNSVFFEKEGIETIDSFLLKKYIIPLGKGDLIFYCFKKILFSQKQDSLILQNNTYNELMTLKTLSDFKPYNKTTEYLF